ncbi:hypothetical protein CYY_008642, partial [Polysphondylium violaceum]
MINLPRNKVYIILFLVQVLIIIHNADGLQIVDQVINYAATTSSGVTVLKCTFILNLVFEKFEFLNATSSTPPILFNFNNLSYLTVQVAEVLAGSYPSVTIFEGTSSNSQSYDFSFPDNLCKDIPLSTNLQSFIPHFAFYNKKQAFGYSYKILAISDASDYFLMASKSVTDALLFQSTAFFNPRAIVVYGKLNYPYSGTNPIKLILRSGGLPPVDIDISTPLIVVPKPTVLSLENHAKYNSFLINISDPSGVAKINSFGKNLQVGTYFEDFMVPVYGNPQQAIYIGYKKFLSSSINANFTTEVAVLGLSSELLTTINYMNVYNPDETSSTLSLNTSSTDFITTFTTTVDKKFDYYYVNIKKILSPYQSYPYGFAGGNLKKLVFSSSIFLPKYNNVNYFTISTFATLRAYYSPRLDFFQIIIQNVVHIPLVNGKLLTRAYLSCGKYGFQSLTFNVNSRKPIVASDLVMGDSAYGVYESIVQNPFIGISTYTLRPHFPTTEVINSSLLKYYKGLRFVDLTLFKFEKNNIDISSQGVWNTVYLNSSNADTTLMIPFKLISNTELANNLTNEQIQWDYLRWDYSLKLYSLKFYIPARLFTGNVHYNLYIQESIVDPSMLSTLFNYALLYVSSTNADEMAPIVGNISRFSDFTNNKVTLVWRIQILDPLNGLESGNLTINSDIDYLGYKFTFGPCDSIDPYQGIYEFNITIDATCRSQTYSIKELTLRDTSGHFSNSTVSKKYEYPITNPFINHPDISIYGLTTQCS